MPVSAMSLDPRLDGAVRLKSAFRDAYERRAYARAFLLAKQLLGRPNLVDRGRDYLERFVRDDPQQQRVYQLWADTLRLPLDNIVLKLLADDDLGATLRESAPVFVVIPADEVRALANATAE